MLSGWTIKRAENAGLIFGAATVLLWVAYTSWPYTLAYPFAVALALTAFCGISILWISARDATKGPKRGRLLRAIRVFDVALGLLLAVPAILALNSIAPDLW